MWLPVIGLLLGIAIGFVFSLSMPPAYSRYVAIAILAALDSIFGAVRAELQGEYENKILLSGLVSNTLLAAGLTFLGDRLGVKLHYAAVAAFGVRLFSNLAAIRQRFL